MIKLKEGDVYEGQIQFSTNGNASLIIDETEIFIYKKNTLNSLHLDKVKIEIFKADKKLEGKVIEVISRFKTEFVGKVHLNKDLIFVIPDSNKMPVDFYIKGGSKAEHGQKVVVEMIGWEPGTKSPKAKIVKILGDAGDNNTEMNSIMYEYGLPVDFPKEVEEEANQIDFDISNEIGNRTDMRDVTTITIDPVDARDFDDALSIKILGDKVEIGVHIADVSHYVKVGTKLDDEALKRATSVYLVDRCVPMLPERLSNGVCSLRPNEDKLCFSVVLTLDMDGKVLDTWFGKTAIHSNRRFTYEEAQEIIEGKDGDFQDEIRLMNDLAKKIRKKRIGDGSIEMGGIEVRFKLADDNKKPIGVYFKEQKEANKLIEEFMLLGNKSVAKLLSDEGYTNVYRTHDTPNMDKLTGLVNVCTNFGYDIKIDDDASKLKKSLNQLLKDIKGKPEENMIETLVTRCMSKATYTIKNIGHYGLGFTHYSHFTSPIRRYPDLMTHRILLEYLKKQKQGNPVVIEDMAKHCSARELVAAKAQRDSIKYKQAEYLLDKIGKVYDGIVSGVTDWGIYVELIESKCEGMIKYSSFDTKFYADVNNYKAYNDFGEEIRLGDEIKVTVSSVDLERKQIDFTRF